MNGYYKIRIMNHDGTWFDCWQEVRGGTVTRYVGRDGDTEITLPAAHDAMIIERNLVECPDTAEAETLFRQRKAEAAAQLAEQQAQEAAQREAEASENEAEQAEIKAAAKERAIAALAAKMTQEAQAGGG